MSTAIRNISILLVQDRLYTYLTYKDGPRAERVKEDTLTSGVFFLNSLLWSTSRFLEVSLSSWRAARSVAVESSCF